MPTLVEIGTVVLEKNHSIFTMSSFSSPWQRAWPFILNKLKYPLPKNALCQVWMWIWIKFPQCIFSIYMYTLTYTTVYLFIHFKHIFNISFFCLSINSFICSYININQYINQLIHSLCVYLITKYLLFQNCLFSIRKNVLMYLMWWGYLVYCLEKLTLAKDVFVKHKCPR